MSKEKVINYRYYHWGPYLVSYTLSGEELNCLEKLFKKEKKLDKRKDLAGHLRNEYTLPKNKVWNIISPYFKSYYYSYKDYSGKSFPSFFKLESTWVNFMKKNEFNPPHVHHGDLSFVIYTHIPPGIAGESATHVATSPAPGTISFHYLPVDNGKDVKGHSFFPMRGDMFIFPANLNHWVYPYKSIGERISISGNVEFEKEKKEKNDK